MAPAFRSPGNDARLELEHAIRTRRTVKLFEREPLDRATLEQLFELASWAPNHHLTNPWRFRVVGPRALDALKQVSEQLQAGSGFKLDRAPTLVAISVLRDGDDRQQEEDLLAGAVAAYLVLLGAHGRGLAGYWRTPAVLRDQAGTRALGIPDGEHPVGLLYLGYARRDRPAPERAPQRPHVEFLD